MTSRIAITLCLLLSVSGPSLASGPPEPGSEAAEDAGATDQTADPVAPSSEDQDTDDTTGQAESDDQDSAPIDVHRHRPGACPEGPPCKGDD
jgi:hypothetical protein